MREDARRARGRERKQILAALEQNQLDRCRREGAAALLGMKRSTLQAHMQRLGIRVSRTVD